MKADKKVKATKKQKLITTSLVLMFLALIFAAGFLISGSASLKLGSIPFVLALASIVVVSSTLTSPIDILMVKSETNRMAYSNEEFLVKSQVRDEIVLKGKEEAEAIVIEALEKSGATKGMSKERKEEFFKNLEKKTIDKILSDFNWMTMIELYDKTTISFNERVGAGEFKTLNKLRETYHEVRYS